MRVLVTGGAGFIGSHVVDRLLTAGHRVAVVDDLSSGRRDQVDPRARLYTLDIRAAELAEVFARERPEAVCHHAAQVDVRRSTVDPRLDAEINILGGLNLLDCALRAGVRKLVYASTCAVYGEPDYLPVDEAHPIRPLSPYGVSKHAFEQYLFACAAEQGLDYSVLRYPNVYGPRQDPHGEAGVVAIFTGRMLGGEACTINGDGEQARDFLFVGDCAEANLLALGEAGSRATLNLASGTLTTINALYTRLASLTGFSQAARHGPAKPGETYRIHQSAERARAVLGWQPRVGLDEGLAATVAHFRGALAPA